jgi:hypothetical protein
MTLFFPKRYGPAGQAAVGPEFLGRVSNSPLPYFFYYTFFFFFFYFLVSIQLFEFKLICKILNLGQHME